MAEPFVATHLTMIGVFAAAVAVLFAIRGARYGRGYRKELEEEKKEA